MDQRKYQKSPPYYHLEFIIRYDNKKIGAFNQSNQKKIFRFFLQIIKDKKNHRIQWPKKKKIIFPPPLPAILLPESLDLKKKSLCPIGALKK